MLLNSFLEKTPIYLVYIGSTQKKKYAIKMTALHGAMSRFPQNKNKKVVISTYTLPRSAWATN